MKKHIRVMRSFRYEGKELPVGTVIEVEAIFATEMIAANKAVGEKPVEVSKPPVVESSVNDSPAAEATTDKTSARLRRNKDAG